MTARHVKYLIIENLTKQLEEGKITDMQYLSLVIGAIIENKNV